MIIRAMAFTDAGRRLLQSLCEKEKEHMILPVRQEERDATIAHAFAFHEALLFIGACGIAVRKIAPYVEDKTKDSPVIVMDESGVHCISLLSGHLGGANALTRHLAELVGAEPVISTATDVQGMFAVDEFARKNQLALSSKEGIRVISGKLLAGGTVRIRVDEAFSFCGEPPKGIALVEDDAEVVISAKERSVEGAVLTLYAKPLYLGMGCKKGVPFERLKTFTEGLDWQKIAAIATIERKRMEFGLQELACFYQVPFLPFEAETLNEVKGTKAFSSFVESTVGVANVCENSALAAAGEGGQLVQEKVAEQGMTYALARRNRIQLIW